MSKQEGGTAAERRAQLRAVADAYFQGLAKKDLSKIPYDKNVALRAPLAPGGAETPLIGEDALGYLRSVLPLLGDVKVIDCYFNEELTAVCAEALVSVTDPPATLRVADRFTVNAEGRIIEQENHYDPRDVTSPGWRSQESAA